MTLPSRLSQYDKPNETRHDNRALALADSCHGSFAGTDFVSCLLQRPAAMATGLLTSSQAAEERGTVETSCSPLIRLPLTFFSSPLPPSLSFFWTGSVTPDLLVLVAVTPPDRAVDAATAPPGSDTVGATRSD